MNDIPSISVSMDDSQERSVRKWVADNASNVRLPTKLNKQWYNLQSVCQDAKKRADEFQARNEELVDLVNNIRLLRLEHPERRSEELTKLYNTIDANYSTRLAKETVLGLAQEYWGVCRKNNDLIARVTQEQEYRRQEREDLQTSHTLKVSELENEKRSLEVKKRQWENEHLKLKGELRTNKEDFDRQLQNMAKERDSRVNITRSDCENRLREALSIHNIEKQEVEKERDHQLQQMKEQCEAALLGKKQEHDLREAHLKGKISELISKHTSEKTKMVQEHGDEILGLKRRHAKQLAEMEKGFENEEASLVKKHAALENRLRKEIESLKGDLLAREDFVPLTDYELQTPYVDLVTEIDQLVRNIEWKWEDPDWTGDLLGQLAKNQRRLRKEIIQDSVWMILNKNIFCSPFRVFGEEGKQWEEKWKLDYPEESQGEKGLYQWPVPSFDAERWRYNTIESCQDAVTKPMSPLDSRVGIKRSFDDTLEKTRQELLDMLSRVSKFDRKGKEAWSSIPKKAAHMWIQMGTQRCRILVVIPGGALNSQSVRARKAREEGLELVVKPELRRCGDSKGKHLDEEEIMVESEGSIVRAA